MYGCLFPVGRRVERYVAGGAALNALLSAPRLSRDRDLFHDTDAAIAASWARDSAFRFYPLIEDETPGLVLHPFDLATNRVLAMAGRLEVRDWIDVLTCDQKLQPTRLHVALLYLGGDGPP